MTSASMDAIDLADLDETTQLELDPSVYAENLSALRAAQPDLAPRVEDVALPAHWRPATALDGFPTYRIEPPGTPPQWLAGTAAPQTRAAALLRLHQLAGKNPALPTIAAGAELALLLERLLPRQAVFVFEDELSRLAAVMRTIVLAPAIAAGRCILLPPGHAQESLERMLERHPGLLPPGSLLRLPGTTDARLARLSSICERVAQRAAVARNQRLEAVASRLAAAPSRPAAPRLAALALGPGPLTHRLATELAGAAERLGWSAARCAANSPRDVHALPHCEVLADFAPELLVCVDHAPAALPLNAGRIRCHWHLHLADLPEQLPEDDTIHLAASPRIRAALRSAGVSGTRVADFFWALPAAATADLPSRTTAAETVVVVGDLRNTSAAACGIEHPTHKQLWAQLRLAAAAAWHSPDILQPATILRNAERRSGVELGEATLRKQMVRIIEHVLIPTVILERIIQELQRERFRVVTIGTGWNHCSIETIPTIADRLDGPAADVAALPALAAVFARPRDPLDPALFQAAALDWPLLIHAPQGAALAAGLGDVLHAREHYEPFADARDLRAALTALQADPLSARRRTAQARAHLRARHTYRQRLQALARQLELDWPADAS